jgi:hypothetical protein
MGGLRWPAGAPLKVNTATQNATVVTVRFVCRYRHWRILQLCQVG